MNRIIELSDNDYKALKEEGVQNHIALADSIIARSMPYEPQKEIVYVCKVTFDKEQLQEIVDKAVTELVEDNKRSEGEWIPVSERLPEEKFFNPSGSDFGFDFEEVLCTTIWGNVRAYKFGKPIGHDKPHFWLGGSIMDEYVIAWQSLPEPYKEGGAE